MQFKLRFNQPYVLMSLIFHILVVVRSISILNASDVPITWNNWDLSQKIFLILSIVLVVYSVIHLWIQHSKVLLYIINSTYILGIFLHIINIGLDLLLRDHSLEIFLSDVESLFFLMFIVFHCVIYPLFRIICLIRNRRVVF